MRRRSYVYRMELLCVCASNAIRTRITLFGSFGGILVSLYLWLAGCNIFCCCCCCLDSLGFICNATSTIRLRTCEQSVNSRRVFQLFNLFNWYIAVVGTRKMQKRRNAAKSMARPTMFPSQIVCLFLTIMNFRSFFFVLRFQNGNGVWVISWSWSARPADVTNDFFFCKQQSIYWHACYLISCDKQLPQQRLTGTPRDNQINIYLIISYAVWLSKKNFRCKLKWCWSRLK